MPIVRPEVPALGGPGAGGKEVAARGQEPSANNPIDAFILARLAQEKMLPAPQAVDLAQETQATLDLYGIGKPPTDEVGRNCLVARRLVERGVRFVQLYSGGGHLEDTWDAHQSIEINHGLHAAEVDQPITALLTDLAQRGLLDSTRVGGGRVRLHALQRRTGRAGTEP